jgi:hypothetical protein
MRDIPVSSVQMVETWLKTLHTSALLLDTLAAPGPEGAPEAPAPALSHAFCTLQAVHVFTHEGCIGKQDKQDKQDKHRQASSGMCLSVCVL